MKPSSSPVALVAISSLGLLFGDTSHPCGPKVLFPSEVCRTQYSYLAESSKDGEVRILLPHAQEGERISARIDIVPAGPAESEADQRRRLSNMVLSWSANRALAGSGLLVWTVPHPTPRPGRRDWLAIGSSLHADPFLPSTDAYLTAPLRDEQKMSNPAYSLAPYQFGSTPIQILGPFSGDLRNTVVTVGSEKAEIIAESSSGVLFRPPQQLSGPQEVTVTEQGATATSLIHLLNIQFESVAVRDPSKNEEVRVTVSGLSAIAMPLRMLAATCSLSWGTNLRLLNGQKAGRFPQCTSISTERREYLIRSEGISPSGVWYQNVTLRRLHQRGEPADGLLDAFYGKAGDEPRIAFDVQPIFDRKVDAAAISSSIGSWQNITETKLSALLADRVRRDFNQQLSLLEQYADDFQGSLTHANDFVESVVRLYLYEVRQKASGKQELAGSGRFRLFAQAPRTSGYAKTMNEAPYKVARFLKEMRERYLLNLGWVEFRSEPARMQVREGETKFLTETADVVSFSPGRHSIVVEGFGQHCAWILDIVEGPPARAYECPGKPSKDRSEIYGVSARQKSEAGTVTGLF